MFDGFVEVSEIDVTVVSKGVGFRLVIAVIFNDSYDFIVIVDCVNKIATKAI